MSAFTTTFFKNRPDLGAIVGTVLVFVVFTLINFHGWWSVFTFKSIMQFTAILAIVALGQALVILCKEIDLSVGSVYGVTAVAFITFEDSLGIVGSFIASLAIAAAIGWINAQLVLRARLVSMIVTLSGLFLYRGVIYVWTGGTVNSLSADGREHWLTLTFGGNLFGFENAVLWVLLLLIVGQITLTRTRFGNHLLAVGGDEPSAHSRGVDVRQVKTTAFVACSTLAGFAGIITICDQPQTHVTLGMLRELESIAAAVIGGCLLTGGRGSLIGPALGAFIITSVRFELIALGAPSSWFITFVGILLIVAVVANRWISDTLAGMSWEESQ